MPIFNYISQPHDLYCLISFNDLLSTWVVYVDPNIIIIQSTDDFLKLLRETVDLFIIPRKEVLFYCKLAEPVVTNTHVIYKHFKI